MPDPEAETIEERPASGLRVQSIVAGQPGRSLTLATAVIVLLIALAVAKPWAGQPGRPGSATHFVARSAVPAAPTPTPRSTADSPEGLAAPICLGAGAWQVASLERWRTQDVRVWRAIAPISAVTGPRDAAIPAVPVVALDLEALGWCAPSYGPDKPVGPVEVRAWFVAGDGTRELTLRQVRPAIGTTSLAALYVPGGACPADAGCPPPTAQAAGRHWASGRIVFEHRDLGAGVDSWFGAEIAVISGDAASSPAPVADPLAIP